MKFQHLIALSFLTASPLLAQEPASEPADDKEQKLEEHKTGSEKLSGHQDELAADVQQLAIEQTVEKVIQLLKECEDIMGEATENLQEHNTGGDTIAAQTEVIEKIYEAAKERQKQSGQGQSGGAMMDMMERMMGKTPEGEGQQKGNKPGNKGGEGQEGESNTANENVAGNPNGGKDETRRIPKASGTAGKSLPEEFRTALDAYNRGLEKLTK